MNAGKLGLLSVGLTLSLAACNLLPTGGPTLTFTATPSTIMPGGSSVLSWSVTGTPTSVTISGGSPAIGNVTNDSDKRVTVTPSATTTYTITATDSSGTSTKTATVTVSGGTGSGGLPGGGNTASAPTGTFGVATTASGMFQNDQGADGPITSVTDPRVITVTAGSTFYAKVEYSDPDGIASVDILLANSSPAGLRGFLPKGGFTVGTPTGSCAAGVSVTQISCTYPITVAAGTPAITALPGVSGEFAYVFRANVTDSLGNSALNTASGQNRGYVNVQ